MFAIAYDLGIDGNRHGTTEKRDGEDDVRWDYEYDALGRLVVEKKDGDEEQHLNDSS